MIKKKGNKFTLMSKDGSKRLSKPGSKSDALKRERQVEYFKNRDKSMGM